MIKSILITLAVIIGLVVLVKVALSIAGFVAKAFIFIVIIGVVAFLVKQYLL